MTKAFETLFVLIGGTIMVVVMACVGLFILGVGAAIVALLWALWPPLGFIAALLGIAAIGTVLNMVRGG